MSSDAFFGQYAYTSQLRRSSPAPPPLVPSPLPFASNPQPAAVSTPPPLTLPPQDTESGDSSPTKRKKIEEATEPPLSPISYVLKHSPYFAEAPPSNQAAKIPPSLRPKVLHLVFDTEFDCGYGIPIGTKYRSNILLQIAWAVVDAYAPSAETTRYYSYFVQRPELASYYEHKFTGITKEMLMGGSKIGNVLDEFMKCVNESEQLVAFNYVADQHHVINELLRLGRNLEAGHMETCRHMCLMRNTRDIVKSKQKNGTYKMPKLMELHQHYFGNDFSNAHDARADVEATLRCYLRYLTDAQTQGDGIKR